MRYWRWLLPGTSHQVHRMFPTLHLEQLNMEVYRKQRQGMNVDDGAERKSGINVVSNANRRPECSSCKLKCIQTRCSFLIASLFLVWVEGMGQTIKTNICTPHIPPNQHQAHTHVADQRTCEAMAR